MRINTAIDEEDEKKAIRILRKGKGAWKEFVHKALNDDGSSFYHEAVPFEPKMVNVARIAPKEAK